VNIIHFIVSRKFHEFALSKFNASLFALTHSVLGKDIITAILKVVVVWSQYQQRIEVQVPNGKLEV